jgi:mannose-1-phosphate guanylyltransferase
MRAILLSAGMGTRLKPITNKIPKCLVQINDRPLLDIWISNLIDAGINEILINTHYMSDKVENFLKSKNYNAQISLTYESKLLGTAGTLLHNYEFAKGEPLMLIHADNLSKFNMQEFQNAHTVRPINCDITMMVFEADDPSSCGIVKINEKNVVVDFKEKPAYSDSTLANAAIYIIEPRLIRKYMHIIPMPTDFSTEIIPKELGKIFVYKNNQYHRDIGTLKSFQRANSEYKKLNDNC